MKIDREHVKETFARYVADYDMSDVKIKLKYDHTYRVAEMCDAITATLDMTPEDRDIAWLTGMLHDIGRFEQLRRYHTFQDRQSVNHAALSADILLRMERSVFSPLTPPRMRFLKKQSVFTMFTSCHHPSQNANTGSARFFAMPIRSTFSV